MKPAQVDLPTIWRNCNWDQVLFYWLDQDGDAFDLTGWQFNAETPQFSLMPTIVNASGGVTSVAMAPSGTTLLRLGVHRWNCWFTPPDLRATPPLLAGKVEVKDLLRKPA